MTRLLRGLILLILGSGGYWAFQNVGGLEGLSKLPEKMQQSGSTTGNGESLPRGEGVIRVASFNIQVFGESKLKKPDVMQTLVQIVRQFDLVAIQELRAKSQDVVPRFVDMLNAEGRNYEYIIGPRLGRSVSKEQYVYIFDAQRIETDHRSVYTVADPADLLHREPLVAIFRARGPDPRTAFTFLMANIHTDPDEVRDELNALDDVYRAVIARGGGEDDLLLLGDLNTDHAHLGELSKIPYLACAITDGKTNTRQSKQYDNILFSGEATTEYTGASGVLDIAAQFGLTMEQAIEVSDHLPVWAEFSVYEGGRPGFVAEGERATQQR